MKNNTIWAIVIGVLIVISTSFIFLYQNNPSNEENNLEDGVACSQDVKQCPDGSFVSRDSNNNCEFFPCHSIIDSETQTHTIIFSSAGISPNSITINKGDRVIWINQGERDFWPASNVHPTHTLYPDS